MLLPKSCVFNLTLEVYHSVFPAQYILRQGQKYKLNHLQTRCMPQWTLDNGMDFAILFYILDSFEKKKKKKQNCTELNFVSFSSSTTPNFLQDTMPPFENTPGSLDLIEPLLQCLVHLCHPTANFQQQMRFKSTEFSVFLLTRFDKCLIILLEI